MRPTVGTMIGDPAGIGPEVIAKAWLGGTVHEYSLPVLIGSAAAMERALDTTGLTATVRTVCPTDQLSDNPQIIDIIDSGALAGHELPLGQDTELCGHATALWLDEADALARDGVLDATIMGPISTGSLKLANKLAKVVSPTPGESYLFLLTGPLRVAHLTDHMPIRQVCDVISADLVTSALITLNNALLSWGISSPRIGVAGLNPHASGKEDSDAIAPGVKRAQAAGVDAKGPISPDSIFRQCIDGEFDMVLAMYHDQGHIPVKTWGFSGNCAIIVGPPYLHLSVAHGTAYDIAGRGVADHTMMLNAMRMAGSLAGGAGFLKD